ncbi:hypothetical protein RD792_000690 [Penstemon davidsonii]|uniref:Uncharacterized protein n=1 Tax=Penstemon davidsonii TaxID=160366 RepID=A0ABR0DLE0_9LAMI|nr:hypothetical protein RD792_000690 [Penstemon davidsonii]
MSSYLTALDGPLISTKNANDHLVIINARRSITYHASVWGDYFLAYTSDITDISEDEEEELEKLKQEVIKKVFVATANDALHKLDLVDAIQRLGVAYHFEKEIDDYLKYIYNNNNNDDDDDLRIVALRFRLLRQQGYNVPANVLSKFMDHESKFKESLVSNAEEMLSLYEAANMAVHGEEILHEALKFSSTRLESLIQQLKTSNNNNNDKLVRIINEALINPIRKSVTRLTARKFISIYEEEANSHDEIVVLNFAKLDFNLLQRKQQKELCDITRWWKALDFENKLPFARNKVVECYFWIISVYFEPQYDVARRYLTKIIALLSITDDIYDVEGTLNDLQLYTDAIQRMDVGGLEQLPPYMRVSYQAVLDVYAEMEEEMEKVDRLYGVHYAKEEMKKMVNGYFEEAKWLFNNYIPTMEEYMKVALVTGGYPTLSTTSLVGMVGDVVTKEYFEWIINEPPIVQAASTICRLMDDMVGYGFETKVSAVGCYMNEHGSSASKEDAFGEFEKQVSKAWHDINQECLHPTAVPMPILMRVLNLARVIHLLYKDDDCYTNSHTKLNDYITYLFIEPVTSLTI